MKRAYKPLDGTPLSVAYQAGDFVFISGLLGFDPETGRLGKDVKAQTRLILQKMEQILKDFNGGLQDVVKCTVYLTKIREDYSGMNEVYAEHFSEDPPARACVEIDMAIDARVEIEAIAYLPVSR